MTEEDPSTPPLTINPHITTIPVHPQHPQRNSYHEPLLLHGHHDYDSINHTSTTSPRSPPFRHQHRIATAYVNGNGGGNVNGSSADLMIPRSDSGGDFEISYDLNNSNYEVNQNHSLNDYTDADRSPSIGPFIGLPHSDSMPGLVRRESFQHILYMQRWWVCFVFFMLSFNQSLIWVTYSPVTDSAKAYYNISESTVDLLLNWGPIINLPLLLFTAKLATSARGLRYLVLATAWCGLIACVLRLIPELIYKDTLHPYSIYFLHAAHILNAAAGPPMQSTVTKVSCIWMGADERTISTAILFVSNNLGATLGFVMGPGLVKQPSDMPKYLYAQLGLAVFVFVCAMIYYPEAPPTYPSKAAEQMAIASTAQAHGHTTLTMDGQTQIQPTFWASVRTAASNKSLVLLAFSSGLLQGVFNCWVSVLSTLLPFGDTTCGWFSFSSSIAGVVAGLMIGPLAQRPKWKRSLKAMILGLTVTSIVMSGWFLLSTQSIFSHSPLIPGSSVTLMGVAISILGFVIGATCPIAFEFAAELSYPLSESVSGSAISGLNNGSSLIFLFVAPTVSGSVMTAFMFGTSIICSLLLIPIHETYVRMDAEQKPSSPYNKPRLTLTDDHHPHGLTSENGYRRRHSSVLSDDSVSTVQDHVDIAIQREFHRVMKEVDEGLNDEGLEEDLIRSNNTTTESDLY